MDRVGEQLLGGRLLDNLAGVHNRDVMGDLGDQCQVVRNEDHGKAELGLKVVKQLDDLLLDGNVQSGRGLVADDQLGIAGKGHSDQNALTLTTGKLMRIALERTLGVEAHELQELLGATGAAALGELLHLGGNEHGGVERGQGVLIDHGDIGTAQAEPLLLAHLEQIAALPENLTRKVLVIVGQAHDGQRGDGLTAAGLAYQAHGLAGTDVKVDVVDDVDVTVVLKLNAEVTDRENRLDRLVGHMAVVTLELDIAQGAKASGEGLSLLLVGTNGVGDQQISLATLGGIGRIQGGGGSSGHGVGNTLREDVERQAGDHNGQAREQRLPPTASEHAAAGVGEDVAPGSGGLLDTSADEGQRGLEDDGVCDQGNGEDHDRGDAVTQNMLDQNPRSLGAGNDDRTDIVLAVLGHDVGTHDTGDLRSVHKADGENDRRHGIAQDGDENGCEGDTRDGHDDVQDTHDRLRDRLARNRCKGAHDRAADQSHGSGAKADNQRVTTTVEHTRQNVATLIIGTEDKSVAGSLASRKDLDRAIGGKKGRQNRSQGDQHQHDGGNLRRQRHLLPATELEPLGGSLLELLGLLLSNLYHNLHRPDARVDEQVEHVNHDVDDDEGKSNDDNDALNQVRLVALNALQNRSAHAGEVEDNLDDDGAAHEVADLKTEGGDRGDQRIAKNVDADDDLLGNAGAASHTDIILVELLDHGGTHDTSHLARQRKCQGDSGHDHTSQIANRIRGEVRQSTRCREHLKVGREQQNQQNGKPERRGCQAGDGKDADHLVRPFVAIQCRDDAEQKRNDRTDGKTDEGQLHRDGQGRGDALGNGVAGSAVGTHVAMNQIAHIAHVAHRPGVVQTILLMVLGNRLGRGTVTQRRVGGVGLGERHKEEHQDGDAQCHDRQRHKTPSNQT